MTRRVRARCPHFFRRRRPKFSKSGTKEQQVSSTFVRGILSAAGYVPYRRLARADIAAFMGSGGGKGTRAVASHDEDTTTLGVEAARLALRSAPGRTPDSAVVRHLASPPTSTRPTPRRSRRRFACPADVAAYDFGGALRSGIGCLLTALRGGGTTLVVAADVRDGLPDERRTSPPEGTPGRPCWSARARASLAEFVATASATDEFTDRWRSPGDRVSKLWEERFGENRYLALGPGCPRPGARRRPASSRATSGGWS